MLRGRNGCSQRAGRRPSCRRSPADRSPAASRRCRRPASCSRRSRSSRGSRRRAPRPSSRRRPRLDEVALGHAVAAAHRRRSRHRRRRGALDAPVAPAADQQVQRGRAGSSLARSSWVAAGRRDRRSPTQVTPASVSPRATSLTWRRARGSRQVTTRSRRVGGRRADAHRHDAHADGLEPHRRSGDRRQLGRVRPGDAARPGVRAWAQPGRDQPADTGRASRRSRRSRRRRVGGGAQVVVRRRRRMTVSQPGAAASRCRARTPQASTAGRSGHSCRRSSRTASTGRRRTLTTAISAPPTEVDARAPWPAPPATTARGRRGRVAHQVRAGSHDRDARRRGAEAAGDLRPSGRHRGRPRGAALAPARDDVAGVVEGAQGVHAARAGRAASRRAVGGTRRGRRWPAPGGRTETSPSAVTTTRRARSISTRGDAGAHARRVRRRAVGSASARQVGAPGDAPRTAGPGCTARTPPRRARSTSNRPARSRRRSSSTKRCADHAGRDDHATHRSCDARPRVEHARRPRTLHRAHLELGHPRDRVGRVVGQRRWPCPRPASGRA